MRKFVSETLLDLKRAFLLVWKCLQYGMFPLADYLPFPPFRRLGFAVRFRRALEDLGLTYLKLGQFLALRFDVLPREVCEELSRLFEGAAPLSADVSRAIVETELGGPLESFFSEFATEPIASASVAAVHRAVMRNGELVAVKIQRPGLEPIFRADIRNLLRVARLVDASGKFGRLSATGMVREFANWTLRELDFTIEARTAERLHRAAPSFVIIPRVYWNMTTRRVLAMEYVEGLSASQLANILARGGSELVHSYLPNLDMDLSLQRLADACLSQLFVDGFFHGDPHPGNILFRNDNLVAFLDFGIFGSLRDSERETLAGQIERLALGDIEASFRFYLQQLEPTEETDFEKFRREAMDTLRRWHHALANPESTIQERHLAKYTAEMIDVSRRNELRYGLNYLLFWRAINNLNATLWLIAPDYDLMGQLRSFFARIRPDMTERLQGVMRDKQAKGRRADEIAGAVWRFEEALERLTKGNGLRHLAVVESPEALRTWRSAARTEALVLLSLSMIVLLTASHLAPVLKLSILGLFIVAVLVAGGRGP